ncbi:MAG: DUF561 domain-containing protein [Candidatus Aenigmarchaeota archaeon]|nr:DUF561 domain-containing protein [Candidatus Aenigmarchaeota archaeon]
MDFDRAFKVAEEVVKEGIEWIEIGTPLIKAEGLNTLREFRKKFPNKTLIADMKTMDTGAVEVEIAAKAGADIVVLQGVADDSTIEDGVKEAQRYGAKIMIDFLGVEEKNIISRAKQLEKIGVDYIAMHLSIDSQMKGKSISEKLKELCNAVKIPVGVAGGLDERTCKLAVENGASILIIGSAVTKQSNVKSAVKRILKSIKGAKVPESRRAHTEQDILKILGRVSSPNVSDAMHGEGAMKGLTQFTSVKKLVGRALTVKAMNGDWSKTVEAIDLAKEGDIIVIDANGGDIALWGELATHSSINKGVKGVIIDGTIRDVDDIENLHFPAFARYARPNAGEPKGLGEIGVKIKCGGQIVNNGDYIIGDKSGIVVMPKKDALEIANRAMSVLENENRVREEIKKGSTLSKVVKLKKWEKLVQ